MSFTPITKAPSVTDPCWISTQYGGYNKCLIIDKSNGSVLPNCTGFAWGAWLKSTDTVTCNLPTGDAGNWYRAVANVYERGREPKEGAIACWSGGRNGQGHVAMVNRVNADGSIEICESGYYSKIMFMTETVRPPYNMNGLTFQGFIYNPAVDSAKMVIKGGRQESSYLGQNIIILGQRDQWRIGMVSASGKDPHTALQPIDQIDNSEVILMGSVNSNYFQMKEHEADPYGEHYGTEMSLTNDFSPHKGNVLAYAVTKSGQSICLPDNQFWYERTDVQFACAPAYVPYIDGKRVDLWSDAFKGTKAVSTQQTMIIRTADRFALAVCTGKLTVQQLREWAEQTVSGLRDLAFMDSGGSTQMMVGFDRAWYTGREIPNIIAFYEPKSADSGGEDEQGGQQDVIAEKDAEIAKLTAERNALQDKIDRISAIIKEETA